MRFSEFVMLVGTIWFGSLSALVARGESPVSQNSVSPRPNVVFIMTDDQGYGDLSCHGNPILKTPNLDQLYACSYRLTDYHVAPTCSPTRSALLTGHWTNRTGVWHTIMGRSLLRANEVTVGTLFQNAGYSTGMFGKWHLGDNYPYRPEDRGFGEVLRHGGGGVGQTPDYWDNAYFDGHYWHNSQPVAVEGFCTDVFFDYAMRFIDAEHQAGKPFFAYIATNAPHGPMHAPEEFAAPYAGQSLDLQHFYGMIANIDHNIGKLREFLKQRGLEENTLLIYTTDNGTSSGAKVFNAGMRGAKGSQFDGGHRVPFFLRWPGGGFDQGRDISTLSAHVDVVPTLLELCGIEAPEKIHFDGKSIVSLLKGNAEAWPDRVLFTDSQRVKDPIKWRASAVMTQQWRLIDGKQLFDMTVDPGQKNDVAEQYPAVVRRLRAEYDQWWAELEPTFSIDAPLYLGTDHENPVRLTSHDWITTQMTAWNQSQIRSALRGPANTGYWNVKVVVPGTYQISLRRWPAEADHPINAGLPPGALVPGQKPFRATPGKAITATLATLRVGDQSWQMKVPEKAREVIFTAKLDSGDYPLEAMFQADDGELIGAYYVTVTRL